MALPSARLRTRLFDIELQSPFVLGSGPLSYDGHGMIRAHKAGAGAVTTKTIRDDPADNPFPHMAVAGRDSMVNAEKWSDISGEAWVGSEIPRAKDAGVVVIGSVGHTPAEAEHWVSRVDEAGADIIELVSYQEATLVPMIRHAKSVSRKPVLAKLSPNWPDPFASAKAALAAGADGLTAMDSLGPALRIDIATARPLLGGSRGEGWLTGSAIKPIILGHVARIAAAMEAPIVGIGGVMTAEDAVEMLMAGADAVGICTAPLLKGIEWITKLNDRLEALLEKLGYASIAEVSGAALANLRGPEDMEKFGFRFDPGLCTSCGACVRSCAYESRTLEGKAMSVDERTCRYCGLCSSVCPTGALTLER